jgi:hypothetical protein
VAPEETVRGIHLVASQENASWPHHPKLEMSQPP